MALIHYHFFSHVLGLATTLSVILPDPPVPVAGASARPPAGPHPTLYLLHGMSDDHTIWQRRTSIERYVEGRHLAVVMPAVHRSFYTDMAAGAKYWTFISEEVPALVRGYFNLSAAREANFVAGLSMGGYGAFKLALAHPERFAAAASLSGALDITRLAQLDERKVEFNHIFGPTAAFAGGPNDLFHLAGQVAQRSAPRPALYQWCGTDDSLYEDNVRFRAHLQHLGVAVDYSEGPGGHEWVHWDRQIERVLAWLPLSQS